MIVGVVGLGLIGGSIAQGILARGGEVMAWTRSEGTRRAAADGGVNVAGSVAEVVEAAPVVVLATPLPVLPHTLDQVAAVLPRGGEQPTVTDVGSVKASIAAHAAAVLPDPSVFVGGHPLAGTEHAGWAAADPDLFEGRSWVLCDPERNRARWDQVAALAERLGATVVPVGSAAHDATVALTSHVPHALAAVLSDELAAFGTDRARVLELSGGSLASATRVVRGGGAALGAEMVWANRRDVAHHLDGVARRLDALRRVLEADDRGPVDELFARASAFWAAGAGEGPR